MAQNTLPEILSLLATNSLTSSATTHPSDYETHDNDAGFQVIEPAAPDKAGESWQRVFEAVFLGPSDAHDDLLFFVKRWSGASADGGVSVRRKGVQFDFDRLENINWKETFLLNLIVQTHCSLTVSICKRDTRNNIQSSSTSSLSADSHKILQSDKELVPLRDRASTTGSGTPSPVKQKSRMIALRRITKKVYAAPYKSRLDVKDALSTPEPSYPLVYYTVNDYESMDLHLHIQEKEYLCVELSVLIGGSLGGDPVVPSVGIDSAPFPVPEGVRKVVFFQGAVPYTALLDVYLQKGTSTPSTTSSPSNHNRRSSSGWANFLASSTPNIRNLRLHNESGNSSRTEYIMMRGPKGKGVCQVAICENVVGEDYVANTGTGKEVVAGKIGDIGGANSSTIGAASGFMGMFGGTVKTGMSMFKNVVGEVVGSSGSVGGGSGGGGVDGIQDWNRKPDSLRCSMTYVNVPWYSIIGDLITAREAGTI